MGATALERAEQARWGPGSSLPRAGREEPRSHVDSRGTERARPGPRSPGAGPPCDTRGLPVAGGRSRRWRAVHLPQRRRKPLCTTKEPGPALGLQTRQGQDPRGEGWGSRGRGPSLPGRTGGAASGRPAATGLCPEGFRAPGPAPPPTSPRRRARRRPRAAFQGPGAEVRGPGGPAGDGGAPGAHESPRRPRLRGRSPGPGPTEAPPRRPRAPRKDPKNGASRRTARAEAARGAPGQGCAGRDPPPSVPGCPRNQGVAGLDPGRPAPLPGPRVPPPRRRPRWPRRRPRPSGRLAGFPPRRPPPAATHICREPVGTAKTAGLAVARATRERGTPAEGGCQGDQGSGRGPSPGPPRGLGRDLEVRDSPGSSPRSPRGTASGTGSGAAEVRRPRRDLPGLRSCNPGDRTEKPNSLGERARPGSKPDLIPRSKFNLLVVD
ncbi:collagen alpha-1(I) chain-like [Canis lupus dingo]|uniref:collagen alpha-1(I) chain-like n=1 Tax=Canis lupus dingo TaxID=286419 RepID=UPI000DC6666F|nr:collagen alpha-1(I) chain-like [Canis lupus dingo]